MSQTIIVVGGFSSNTGKTTLMCELLRAFPGWEAVKLTRGHYRSCGKDPQACCVSHLLGQEPVIRSGHAETYAHGKDSGRYWDAGAANVHWLIATEGQVEQGIKGALARVQSPGVFIEGTSILKYIEADLAILTARAEGGKLKSSARRALALNKISALYLSEMDQRNGARERFASWLEDSSERDLLGQLETYTRAEIPQLVERIRAIQSAPVPLMKTLDQKAAI